MARNNIAEVCSSCPGGICPEDGTHFVGGKGLWVTICPAFARAGQRGTVSDEVVQRYNQQRGAEVGAPHRPPEQFDEPHQHDLQVKIDAGLYSS